MWEMRRKDREMDADFAYSVIDKAQHATIATKDKDGNIYCIPISVARLDNKIYIHSAYKGRKIENIKQNPNVCMSFVGDVKTPPPLKKEEFEEYKDSIGKLLSKKFTTEYESAVVFGKARIVKEREEKILGLRLICEKYVPENMPFFDAAIKASLDRTCVIRIDIEWITGKRKKFDKYGIEMKWGRTEEDEKPGEDI